MSDSELYPDQAEKVGEVRDAMTRSRAVLLQSPTGSGKTRMATHIIKSAKGKGKKIGFTVPRKDLLEQTSETFDELGIIHSYVAAGKPYNPDANVFIGMVDTMAMRLKKDPLLLPRLDLVIEDEAHYGEGARDALVKHYTAQGSYRLGLSATPWKLSGKGLKCWYNTMVPGKSIAWLIQNDRLSDYRYFRGHTKPDLTKIKCTAGDYNKGEIASFMEHQGVIIGDCVNDYRTRAMGRLHIVRCASIKHSNMVAEQFRQQGIPAVHVDGETPMDERKRIFRAFARREILVLTFADLLNFGFDLSQASGMDVCIEGLSDLKPSKSLAGQLQFWGRGLRWKPYPAIFNDHVGNYIDHGLPRYDRDWSLEDRERKKASERSIAVKQCDNCFYCHPPAPQCPDCGHVYVVKSRTIAQRDGELVEIVEGDAPPPMSPEQVQRMLKAIDDLTRTAIAKGVPAGRAREWAAKKIKQEMAR